MFVLNNRSKRLFNAFRENMNKPIVPEKAYPCAVPYLARDWMHQYEQEGILQHQRGGGYLLTAYGRQLMRENETA